VADRRLPCDADGPKPPEPLADLRVVDCATVVAGPGAARHLADFGADVVKVERPGEGDGLRAMGWADPADGVPMQGPIARLSATPSGVRWPARPLGADNDEVLGAP